MLVAYYWNAVNGKTKKRKARVHCPLPFIEIYEEIQNASL
jgi:hypothetical protein